MALAYELIGLEELATYELDELAVSINGTIRNRATRWLLRSRYLPGVIKRHSGSVSNSLANLERARNADKNILSAFAIRQTIDGEFVGMATSQNNLKLQKQPIPAPPKLSRITRLGKDMELGERPNVAAWVGAHVDQYSALGEAYRSLMFLYPEGSWTREPVSADSDIHTAIQDAGYHAWAAARFDDEETSWVIPPVSRFYRTSV